MTSIACRLGGSALRLYPLGHEALARFWAGRTPDRIAAEDGPAPPEPSREEQEGLWRDLAQSLILFASHPPGEVIDLRFQEPSFLRLWMKHSSDPRVRSVEGAEHVVHLAHLARERNPGSNEIAGLDAGAWALLATARRRAGASPGSVERTFARAWQLFPPKGAAREVALATLLQARHERSAGSPEAATDLAFAAWELALALGLTALATQALVAYAAFAAEAGRIGQAGAALAHLHGLAPSFDAAGTITEALFLEIDSARRHGAAGTADRLLAWALQSWAPTLTARLQILFQALYLDAVIAAYPGVGLEVVPLAWIEDAERRGEGRRVAALSDRGRSFPDRGGTSATGPLSLFDQLLSFGGRTWHNEEMRRTQARGRSSTTRSRRSSSRCSNSSTMRRPG